jgi:hypothetical protein
LAIISVPKECLGLSDFDVPVLVSGASDGEVRLWIPPAACWGAQFSVGDAELPSRITGLSASMRLVDSEAFSIDCVATLANGDIWLLDLFPGTHPMQLVSRAL